LQKVTELPLQEWGENGRSEVANAWQNYEKRWLQLLDAVLVS